MQTATFARAYRNFDRRPPTLVLNADHRPLSYFPLSLWTWREVATAVYLDRVNVLSVYDEQIRGASLAIDLPSVVSLKTYVSQEREPSFTRFNVFLRDGFACQYCGSLEDLTFDHLIPRSRGGRTTWENVLTSCARCNFEKGARLINETTLKPRALPRKPTLPMLQAKGRRFPPKAYHASWIDYLYWDLELEA